ncbi:unnamed protein product, partial [Rotaria magnacalcarata]
AYALVVRQTSPAILRHHELPSNRYIGLLRNGAAYHNIHPLYIEYLQSLPSIERSKCIMVLVTIEILSVITLLSPIWIPTVIYGNRHKCPSENVLYGMSLDFGP